MNFEQMQRFRDAWEAVRVERSVPYTLFTFGESVMPYFLVCSAGKPGELVSLTRGEVRIARPLIITADNAEPEFRNFFESDDEGQGIEFLLARSAAFSHLKFNNQHSPAQLVTDSVEETVAKLGRRLDDEDEDRVAILSAPKRLGGLAVLKYATERVIASAPDNVTELREKGFLPG